MVQSQASTLNVLPPDTRWLDLFAGTGSVGIEALSRGAATCHFVEMDAWVTKKVGGWEGHRQVGGWVGGTSTGGWVGHAADNTPEGLVSP